MNLGNLRSLARAQVPTAKKSLVSPDLLRLILNNGKDDVASKTICLNANQKFNIVAVASGIAEYNLSTVVERFLVMDRPGLFYLDGTNYKQLYPRTIKWLDENRPHWRTEGPGTPRYYYQNGNILGLVPAPSTAVTSGGWLYFGQKPPDMTADGNFPFGGGSEIIRLVPLHYAILSYARWQLTYIVNKGMDNYRLGERQYLAEVEIRKGEIGRRLDISADESTKLQGGFVV